MHCFLKFIHTKNRIIERSIRETLYSKSWVVYAKQPFLGASQVIKYLARYTHKVAISNHRIQSIEDGKVTFSYKDYSDECTQKQMTLDATEFLKRFCLHILPPRFMKIRHYGFSATRHKSMLRLQQKEMGVAKAVLIAKDWKTILKEKTNFDVDQCPCCKKGRMTTILNFEANAPPNFTSLKLHRERN